MKQIDMQQLPASEEDLLHFRQWKKAAPFMVHPRRHLVHRVRRARTYIDGNGKPRHDIAEFWCGATGSGQPVTEFLTDKVPKDRLLCARCESVAVSHGQVTAAKLCGRHVCTGRMVVQRQCCQSGEN